MSLLTPAGGLNAVIELMAEVERMAPGVIVGVSAEASLSDYSHELPSCRLTLRAESVPFDQIEAIREHTFEVDEHLRYRLVGWESPGVESFGQQWMTYRLDFEALSIIQASPAKLPRAQSCKTCVRAYEADGLLCCGAGSTQDPRPYWATADALLRILKNGGQRTGLERAEDIDHHMAQDCAAFESSGE